MKSSISFVGLLLAHNANPDPNKNDERNLVRFFNSLVIAASNMDYDTCKLLLRDGADVNTYSGHPKTTAIFGKILKRWFFRAG